MNKGLELVIALITTDYSDQDTLVVRLLEHLLDVIGVNNLCALRYATSVLMMFDDRSLLLPF